MRALFTRLFDDAALFPPGNAPMDQAIPAHLKHRAAWYADLVGPFICPDNRLAEIAGRVPLSVIVTAGPPAVETVARLVAPGLLAAIEFPAVRDAVGATAAARSVPAGLPAFVEVPWNAAQAEILDALAGTGAQVKLRTGGTTAGAFPSAAQLAVAIAGCLDRDLAFKCTAGLHHAVRHTADDTGFEHHGFLNVLLATAALLDGADVSDAANALAERSPGTVAGAVRRLDDDRIALVRSRFRSFGTCSITEPLDDLDALGLLDTKGIG
jgi:hypothetical protein